MNTVREVDLMYLMDLMDVVERVRKYNILALEIGNDGHTLDDRKIKTINYVLVTK